MAQEKLCVGFFKHTHKTTHSLAQRTFVQDVATIQFSVDFGVDSVHRKAPSQVLNLYMPAVSDVIAGRVTQTGSNWIPLDVVRFGWLWIT